MLLLYGKNLPKLPQLGEIEQLKDMIPADDGSDSDSDAEEAYIVMLRRVLVTFWIRFI
jgi:hypothetical protein